MKMFLAALVLSSFAFGDVSYQMIGGVPANNLCDNGAHFLTINPVKVCAQWNHKPGSNHGEMSVPDEWTCSRYEMQQLVVSKDKTVCLEFSTSEAHVGCTRWGKDIQGNKTVAERVKEYGDASTVDYFDYYIRACYPR